MRRGCCRAPTRFNTAVCAGLCGISLPPPRRRIVVGAGKVLDFVRFPVCLRRLPTCLEGANAHTRPHMRTLAGVRTLAGAHARRADTGKRHIHDCAHERETRVKTLGIRSRAGERRGDCHAQGRARVRRRGDLRHQRDGASPFGRARRSAPRLRACGGPAPDRRRVQNGGGAVYMGDGAVTFRGSSTITRTRAVRPARRTPSRAHALLILACGASTGTATGV